MRNKTRFLAFLLSLAILFEFMPFSKNLSTTADDFATIAESFMLDGVFMEKSKRLTDLGNRTYRLDLVAKSSIKVDYTPERREYSEDGYYVADADGYYLLEMWGGCGGNGDYHSTGGGKGGKGGYVYGYVWMDAGQVLVFTVGTSGTITHNYDDGGANGGGGHGTGMYSVGSGGGYTAAYVVDGDAFDAGWFDGNELNETAMGSHHMSDMVMVAAGAGGAGTGPMPIWYDSDYVPKGYANGGNGGTITSTRMGHLSANDNNGLAGYYFSGENGKSLGSSTLYVGKAGTGVPGAAVHSKSGSILVDEPSESGNDWSGTYNVSLAYGAGGASSLRGGGGGAGFCGGSGGTMTTSLDSSNTGGGGGGSSFIADSVTWQNLSAKAAGYLAGEEANPHPVISGSLNVTFLGEDPETVSMPHLQNVSLSGTISQYFDIVNVMTNGNGTATWTAGNAITVTGIDMTPGADGYADSVRYLNVNVLLRAKTAFLGGNNVPVISDIFSFVPVGYEPIVFDASADTDYCNVPIKVSIKTYNFTTTVDVVKYYQRSDLYTDPVESYRSSPSSNWQSAFINSFGSINVTISENASLLRTSGSGASTNYITQNQAGTAKLRVYFTITPRTTAYAKVGARVTSVTVDNYATITIVGVDTAILNELTVTGSKILEYKNDKYQLSVSVDQRMTDPVFVPTISDSKTTPGDSSFVVEYSGWYYVQLWGGDGQKPDTVRLEQYNSNSWDGVGTGGAAGKGGYISGYIYLEEGDVLVYTVGAAGTGAEYIEDFRNGDVELRNNGKTLKITKSGIAGGANYGGIHSTGGGGGKYTSLMLNGDYLAIAGGGGGGGGAGGSGNSNGKDADSKGGDGGNAGTSYISSGPINLAEYNGGAGTQGSTRMTQSGTLIINRSFYATAGEGGDAGLNFRANLLGELTQNGKTISSDAQRAGAKLTSTKSGTAGQFTVTLLESEAANAAATMLAETGSMDVEGTISRYFDIDDVNMTSTLGLSGRTKIGNPDGSYSVSYNVTNGGTTSYNYMLTENADHTTRFDITDVDAVITSSSVNATVNGVSGKNVTYHAIATFVLMLSPKDGFMGGNDVPLLIYDVTDPGATDVNGNPDRGIKITQGSDFLFISAKDETDYANVNVVYDFTDEDLVTQDMTIHHNNFINTSRLIVSEKTEAELFEGYETWQYEFVTAQRSSDSSDIRNVTPTTTTTYDFTQKIVPIAAPQKAKVVAQASSANNVVTATVYVECTIVTEFTNLTWNGPDSLLTNTEMTGIIEADRGYLLPETIEVYRTGTLLSTSAYTYDSSTGTVVIPAANMTGNIRIVAAGGVQTFTLHYRYETYEGTIEEFSENYQAEEAIIDRTAELTPSQSRYGYSYIWEWSTPDNIPLTQMPASDWWVVGTYMANPVSLTINYFKQGESTPFDVYQETYGFGAEYNVVSPQISGWIAQSLTVSGTIDTEDSIVIDVYYTPASGLLTIIYVLSDSDTVYDTYTDDTLTTGAPYSVDSPVIPGYTPDQPVVQGNLGEEGTVVYVRYSPNQYTVTFDPNEGTLADTELTKTVVYNNIYGFDPTKDPGEQYGELPQPFRSGFDFLGWFDGDDNEITEETVVKITDNQTLTAKWGAKTFKLTIYCIDSNGDPMTQIYDNGVYTDDYEVGQPYSITVLTVDGYTNVPLVVEGTMGAGNKVEYVVYTIVERQLTIYYEFDVDVPEEDKEGIELPPVYQETLTYGSQYSVTSPEIEGFNVYPRVVQGTIYYDDVTVTVYYTKSVLPVSVLVVWGDLQFDYINQPHGSGWDPMTHTYESLTYTYSVGPHTPGENTVTVTNTEDSGVAVNVSVEYEQAEAYTDQFTGKITVLDDENDDPAGIVNLAIGDSQQYFVWLNGEFSERKPAGTSVVVGHCIVTITGG